MNHSPFPQTRHSLHNLLHLSVPAPPIKRLLPFPFACLPRSVTTQPVPSLLQQTYPGQPPSSVFKPLHLFLPLLGRFFLIHPLPTSSRSAKYISGSLNHEHSSYEQSLSITQTDQEVAIMQIFVKTRKLPPTSDRPTSTSY
ncbi:hypothetical protein CGRA01v4_00178 [Colletotrichum graminicola]|nr:hypothetical protein CGRA01v4_00178 [Colletotrichum graminicola]